MPLLGRAASNISACANSVHCPAEHNSTRRLYCAQNHTHGKLIGGFARARPMGHMIMNVNDKIHVASSLFTVFRGFYFYTTTTHSNHSQPVRPWLLLFVHNPKPFPQLGWDVCQFARHVKSRYTFQTKAMFATDTDAPNLQIHQYFEVHEL